jgi:hypothetical protein
MLGLLKVVVVMAVMAVIGGLGVHWAMDETSSAIHRALDTSLPEKVSAHPWAPLHHGKKERGARVVFSGGTLTTVRCHAALGSYAVQVNHGFSFHRAATPVKAGCPGGRLTSALRHATRVEVESEGDVDTMTFMNQNGRTVATLQARRH